MDPIQAAIEEIDLREPGEDFKYTEIAAKYDVERSTPARRHKSLTSSRSTKNLLQRKLSPQQEKELIQYIQRLTEHGLPPTRE
jgi:hypothetical protein